MKTSLSIFLLAFALIAPLEVFAQNYTSLVNIPNVDANASFGTLIDALYGIAISVAALLAVIKIIIAGVKWMMSDVVTNKQDAKNEIKGALLGLLVIIGAVLVLNTINPNLADIKTNFDNTGAVDNPFPGNFGPSSPSPGGSDESFIIDYCSSVGGECEVDDCESSINQFEGFLSNLPGAFGPIFGYIDSAGNSLKCELACNYKGGQMGTNVCAYPSNHEVAYDQIINTIIDSADICNGAGCDVLDCRFFRGFESWTDVVQSCKSDCEDDRGGIFVDTGLLDSQCVVPLSTAEISDQPCIFMGRGEFDCTLAISSCVGEYEEISDGSRKVIRCGRF